MIQVRILECKDPLADHLEQFKQYASVPDDSRDGILQKMLKRAMLAVQESSNVAMLPCKLEVMLAPVWPGDTIRLYQGGKTIISVKDTQGEDLVYAREGDVIKILETHKAWSTAVVVYQNEVIVPEAEKLQPVVWQLATAIYDGEDASVQNAILRQTYGML